MARWLFVIKMGLLCYHRYNQNNVTKYRMLIFISVLIAAANELDLPHVLCLNYFTHCHAYSFPFDGLSIYGAFLILAHTYLKLLYTNVYIDALFRYI